MPEPCISRSVVEILDVEYAAELAQYLIAGAPVLIDLGPRLGCACSGAVSGVTASQARDAVVAIEPPRSPTPVVEPDVSADVDLDPAADDSQGIRWPTGRCARTRSATVDRITAKAIITVIPIATMGTARMPIVTRRVRLAHRRSHGRRRPPHLRPAAGCIATAASRSAADAASKRAARSATSRATSAESPDRTASVTEGNATSA